MKKTINHELIRESLFKPSKVFSNAYLDLKEEEKTLIELHQPSNASNKISIAQIKETIALAKKTRQQLEEIDMVIASSFAVALLTYTFVPFWSVSLVATAVCTRNCMLRDEAHKNQQQALKNLLMVWELTMNNDESVDFMKKNKELVSEMLEQIYPLVNDHDYFKAITNDDIENALLNQGKDLEEHATFAGRYKVDKQYAGVLHDIYGYEQEVSFFSMTKALCQAFPNMAHYVFELTYKLYSQVMNLAPQEQAEHAAQP